MKESKLENISKEVSLLGLGCMRLPLLESGEVDKEHVHKMVDYAFKNGLNYVDTAYFYHGGESESVMGEVLSNYERSSYYLSTKLPLWVCDGPEDVDKVFFNQLEKLQTDYIDFYFMHAMNAKRVKKMQDWGVLDKLIKWKEEGKIKHIGFSFHGSYEDFQVVMNAYDWEVALIQLNYIDANHQQGLQGLYDLEAKGIPAFIMEPVKGGNLAGFADDIEKYFYDERPNDSITSWALRWLGSLDNVKVILSGMSSLENMEDNINTCTDFEPLTEKEGEIVEVVAKAIKSRLEIDCTGCNYCLPCPFNVNIPKSFNTYNDYRMYQKDRYLDWAYGLLLRDKNGPEVCTECGICIDKCPQELDIPELLEKVASINPRR